MLMEKRSISAIYKAFYTYNISYRLIGLMVRVLPNSPGDRTIG